MSALTYYIICAVLSIMVLIGISKMSKVETATNGNRLSALSLFLGVILTLVYYDIFDVSFIYICILIGSIIGYFFAKRIKMIQMPQLVALLNGIGGAASAFVGILSYVRIGSTPSEYENFTSVTAVLAIVVGLVTLVGSLVAAGKLHKVLPQKPIVWKNHQLLTTIFIIGSIVPVVGAYFSQDSSFFFANPSFVLLLSIASSCLFGLTFAIRVGGADMPITISLLNSLSGVAGAIAGMAIGDILLVSVGGIVGASGLLLTQIMCRNMNRHLIDILLGKTSAAGKPKAASSSKATVQSAPQKTEKKEETLSDIVSNAKEVILIPGYGMALAQAQHQVKQLADKLEKNGAKVRFAVHPVAGRMPGHMNVLLAEADVPYDELYEMEQINDDFKKTDLVIVIGANDVVNPAAREAEGTPIYGMPVLNADQAKNVIVCNYDTKPGYAGVENPLYKSNKTKMLLGDAKESLYKVLEAIHKPSETKQTNGAKEENRIVSLMSNAKSVILIPGYGMALAQAQHQVKQLADKLEKNGAKVRFAVHPVAGRMPGHMNVLLAEADVPYDELYEMEQINDDFKDTDLTIIIGANDVVNPAAREAEGTPIYGMPVLNADQAKNVIVCNYDTKPGYAGVENPLYSSDKAELLLGDAKESLNKLIDAIQKPGSGKQESDQKGDDLDFVLSTAKSVILVPGYGMALAQAQHQVKQLADKLERNGAKVRFAVHPVAGRMPGHMNVLLAEADVPYDELYEMEQINDDFKETDLAIVIGANDVINPAAREAEGTPIYGMPVLNVDEAKQVIICNYDTKPGYAGVDNPLYNSNKARMLLGDAKESLNKLLEAVKKPEELSASEPCQEEGNDLSQVVNEAKQIILIPGYGMALAQAQHQVKQLADKFEQNGAKVRFAVHPVAGRMPGHMNVLLAEADVPYDELYEMEQINDDFKDTDLVIIIGANDVVNPAAREAEGTPIYGMPVLNADQAKHVIVCNFDTKPGYAGVENPLYESDKTTLLLGDAKESVHQILDAIGKKSVATSQPKEEGIDFKAVLKNAKEVILVPGYGMALAQAQHQVKQLADKLERNGARVRFAVHPVAGRMPGHMNVLLAEADVPYDELYEMEQINDDFAKADLAIVVGANDVVNPAAREAEGTPIYGMPVLNVDQAKNIIVCNFDTKPGYAGVDNPLYESPKAKLMLGDAKESLLQLLDTI